MIEVVFSEFIVFADESGSPVLTGGDPDFPVFVLSCILVRKSEYAKEIVPEFQRLKFDFLGHDQVVLHERDVRRQQKDFAFLQVDRALREDFLGRLSTLVEAAPIRVICAAILKDKLKAKYQDPWSPYEIALHFCMERIFDQLIAEGEEGKLLHVIFEARGANEDRELELQFRQIAACEANWGWRSPNFRRLQWEAKFVGKSSN
jgi:hypothetical protein